MESRQEPALWFQNLSIVQFKTYSFQVAVLKASYLHIPSINEISEFRQKEVRRESEGYRCVQELGGEREKGQ